MSGETVITVIGNLVAAPELRFTPAGAAVANFTVASTPRFFDRAANEWKDGEALFLRCNVWREAAENAAESLTRGSRVIVSGRLKQRSYETREGDKRTVVELDIDEVGPSLRYARAVVTKTIGHRDSSSGNGFGDRRTETAATPTRAGAGSAAVAEDSWTSPATGADTGDGGGSDAWSMPAFAGAGVFGGEPDF